MKKLFAIALIAVMPFLLISCGGNNNDVDMSPSPEVSIEDNLGTETFDNNTSEVEENTNTTTLENEDENLTSPSAEVTTSVAE